jgi:hypothetical protein
VTDDHWRELDQSGKTDEDIKAIGLEFGDPRIEERLTDALFLFALRKVQGARKEDLEAIWTRYQYWWIRRLPQEAYYYVKCECAGRATGRQECSGATTQIECRQLSMNHKGADDDNEPF